MKKYLDDFETHPIGTAKRIKSLLDERKNIFREGFDAGMRDTADKGPIVCPEFYEEVLEEAWQELNREQHHD